VKMYVKSIDKKTGVICFSLDKPSIAAEIIKSMPESLGPYLIDRTGIYLMAKHKKSKTKRNGNGTKIRKGRKRKTILSRKVSK